MYRTVAIESLISICSGGGEGGFALMPVIGAEQTGWW